MSDPSAPGILKIENTSWLSQGIEVRDEMLTSIAISLKRIADHFDALRAYDEAHAQPEQRREVMQNQSGYGDALEQSGDKSAAPLAGADPPWFAEARAAARAAYVDVKRDWDDAVVRAVLDIAAAHLADHGVVKTAAIAAHLEFHKINYGDEVGTADSVAHSTWPTVKARRLREMHAALAAAAEAWWPR